MKKITVLTTGILCAASLAIGASASGIIEKIQAELRPDFTIIYEGNKQNLKNVAGEEVYPILYEGSTYLPVRAVSEMINKEVTWYEADKRIEITDAPEITVTDADKIVTEDTGNKNNNRPAGSSGNGGAPVDKAPVNNEKPIKNDRHDDDRIPADANVTIEDAKKLVFEKAGVSEADVRDFEIDVDDGRAYEIEFNSGRIKYEAKVSIIDGTILEWEMDD